MAAGMPPPVADVSAADQAIAATPQRVHSANNDAESSSRWSGHKSTSSAKEVNGGLSQSGSSSISALTSIANSNGPAIAPDMLVGILPTEKNAASSEAKNTSGPYISTGAPTAGSHVRNPQMDATPVMGETMLDASGNSIDGIPAMHDQVPDHGVRKEDASSSATPNTDPTQDGKPTAMGGASQSAFHGDRVSAQPQMSAVAKNVVDTANTSDPVSASAIGTLSDRAKNIGRDSCNTAISPTDTKDGLRSASFSSAISTPGLATRDPQTLHSTFGDASSGLQNGSSVFSSVGHPSASGSLSSPTTGSTSLRATTADAFTALDSAASGERGVLLHAAPHQVAVGITDPSLGWVEVRAERVSGQIAAALIANSAASHAALTAVLPTMANYLQEHHPGVQQVHVEPSLTGGQAGAGSQGQASSQSEGRTPLDNLTRVNQSTNSWSNVPSAQPAVTAGSRINPIYEGHRFSIRA
ncbi:MAG: hypothetical protein V4587_08510 [Acidobacteriota bacterium]